MRRFVVGLIGIAITIVVAGATLTLGDSDYTSHASDKKYAEPTSEAALVYVLRPGLGHAGDKTWWFVGDQVIGVSKAQGYSLTLVPEGRHLFWMAIKLSTLAQPRASTPSSIDPYSHQTGWSQNMPVLELEVEKGRTYYLEMISKPGVSGVVSLDEAGGKKALEQCAYTELTVEGRRRGAGIAEDLIAGVRKKAASQRRKAEKKAAKQAKKDAKKQE